MTRQVTKWEAEDGSLHDTEGAAQRADLTDLSRKAARQLAGQVCGYHAESDMSDLMLSDARHMVTHLADCIRAEDAGPGAQDLRRRAHAIAVQLSAKFRAAGRGAELLTAEELSELANFAGDVCELPHACMSTVAREPGPLESERAAPVDRRPVGAIDGRGDAGLTPRP